MSSKWIFKFGSGEQNISTPNSSLLGGKGSALSEMSALGIRVPPGFTISTELCKFYYDNNKQFPTDFESELESAIIWLQKTTGKIFGGDNPLLVSVRSGAKESMPGMMDTILNLGLSDETVIKLAKISKNELFALDSYRRLLQMYGTVVLKVQHSLFERIIEEYPAPHNYNQLKEIVEKFKGLISSKASSPFPQDIKTQIYSSIKAVLCSWMSDRAIIYRHLNNISNDIGTAVNIQAMVFGNKGQSSATGVVFSRNPSNGEKKLYGEYLINAQGEDVVAGIRTPHNISSDGSCPDEAMQFTMPKVYKELESQVHILEKHYKDMQDIEFTIEEEVLYILQTRSGKRTAAAAIKIAVNMADEKLITKDQAIMAVDPESIHQLLHARIDYKSSPKEIAKGLPASPGAAIGIAVFSPNEAEELSNHHKVILVRTDTSPEDIKAMHMSNGILTVRGGMTSHAAVVARGMGRPCVCGTSSISVNEKEKYLKIDNIIIKQGEEITIDGSTGKIFSGALDLITPEFTPEFSIFMSWVDEKRCLKIRANAETVLDSNTALRLGAEGIGLCRTEHMFFSPDKIALMREMIVSPNPFHREEALKKLLPIHKEDFKQIFSIMKGLPVNVRLLDPPLHEFLPHGEEEKLALAQSLNLPWNVIEKRLQALHEVNPMLGHRGCRLGITFPAIYEMQAEAIFAAAVELKSEGINIDLEIMLPLISEASEFLILKNLILKISDRLGVTKVHNIKYSIGTMIELPRAALKSDKIAVEADYFSFGTNDLTQTTFGISRDDGGSFIPDYLSNNILKHDPFITIDEEGVGELIKISIERGRKAKPNIKLGICGEHGGDPKSIGFFHNIGIDYVSCSPYRVPIAKIAAAQANIKDKL